MSDFKQAPYDEPVDERRNTTFSTFVSPHQINERLIAQPYRPEILNAKSELTDAHKCVPLSALARTRIGQGITPTYGDDGPQCIKLKHVRHLFVNPEAEVRVSTSFADTNPGGRVEGEVVFINRQGGFTVGRAGAFLDSDPVFASDSVFTFVPDDGCDAAFVACFLNSWWGKRSLESGINGSTGQLVLLQGHVEAIPVPEFDYAVQLAIGNKLRKAYRLAAIAQSHRSRAVELFNDVMDPNLDVTETLLDTKKHATFINSQDLIDVIAAPSYEPVLLRLAKKTAGGPQLGSYLADAPRLGVTGKIEHEYVSEDCAYAVPYITTKQVRGFVTRPKNCKFISASADKKWKKCRVFDGDILINKSGNVGAATVLKTGSFAHCNSVSDVINVRLKPDCGLCPYFLVVFLNSPWGLAQLKRLSGGAVFSHVSIYSIPEVRLPNIEPAMQDDISKAIQSADEMDEQSANLRIQVSRQMRQLIDGELNIEQLLHEAPGIAEWLGSNAMTRTSGTPK